MRDISVFKKRILQFADKFGITKYEIYQNTGISNGVFSQKGGLSEDNLLKFLSYYKEISCDWLITGEGEMLRGKTNTIKKQSEKVKIQDANEYLVHRFEELIIENTKLKSEISFLKSKEKHSSDVVSTSYVEKEIKSMFAAEPEQEKLKK